MRFAPFAVVLASLPVAVVGCMQDFDVFSPDETSAEAGTSAADASPRDSGTIGDARPPGTDAGGDSGAVDCRTKSGCYTAVKACSDACTTAQDACISGCGGNNGCRNRCRSEGDTCRQNCVSTCKTCAGDGCTPACTVP